MKCIPFLFAIFLQVTGQLLLKKENVLVLIGREVYLNTQHLQFKNSSLDAVCKVEVLNNEPMTQQVGVLLPQVFDCSFNSRSVKYIHHGSPLLSNDTVKLRAYKFLEHDTISEYFDLVFEIENSPYDVIQPGQPLIIKEFFGLSDAIDGSVLNFNFSRKEGAICKVKMSRNISQRPAHGQIVVGRERRSIDIIKRRCDDFLQLGLRYEHLRPPSPNADFILIIVEVSDPLLNGGSLIIEWYQIPVIIEPGFPNLPPKASFSGMYLMDVDQFIITAITPAVLSATDSETPSDQLVFNISRPLLFHQGSIVHLSDHTRPINSFRQSDLNNFDIAYKPPARSFKDRQMFEIQFIIRDPDFTFSEPFTMHIAIRPAITTAPRVSMNVGMVLLEGQSRPLRRSYLEVVDSDNLYDVNIFVAGGLHHGRLELNGKPAVSFTQQDIVSETIVYHHDDSDSIRDSIHLRVTDGFHSTHVKFPITIIPKDDNYPSLVINVGLKVREGGEVQIVSSLLRAVDQDTSDEHVKFIVTKFPLSGQIRKKFSWEKNGKEILTFTQQDINKGLIYFLHDGDEIFTDVIEIKLQDANNPPNMSPTYEVFIQITPIGDDPPKRDPASTFSLEVREIDVGIFKGNNLHFMDIDSEDHEIVYTLTTQPRFIGSFAHADTGKIVFLPNQIVLNEINNLTAIQSFTQQQINHQKIAYLPPVDEIGPNPLYLQFIFSVTDKDKNKVTGQVFNITILPVNNQVPQLHTGELLVEEGSSTLLSTNELSVYDPDTLSSDLQMSLFTVPLHGSLRRSDQTLRVGDLLSLDDILTLRLEYSHDGSEHFKDGFMVGVNDGSHFVSGDVLVSIEPIDDEKPVWKNDLQSHITVPEGGKIQITSQILAATDVDTEDSSLYFIVTEAPLLGNIVVEKQKTNRFLQKNVLKNEVFYIHNNQEIGPSPKEDSMTFIVTDKIFLRSISHSIRRVFITILPQNTQLPRLYFKRALLVEEGHQIVITEENLSATDEDTFPAELLIVLTKHPLYGYLENSRTTTGYEKKRSNREISAFPLQDVKDGFITFVQYNHSGIEPESDDFEVFVTDGVHNSTSVLVYVSIILLNDEAPFFHLSNITLDEGSSYVMNNDSIIATDRDYPGDIIVLNVKIKPKYGLLTHFLQAVNKGPILEIPFNQLAFEYFEKIVYHHDGSENFVDSFTLSLSDGVHSVTRTCFVEINSINDEPPLLQKNIPAEFSEMQDSLILSNAYLLAEDADSLPTAIIYKLIKTVSFGHLERLSNEVWTIFNNSEFSQEDINLNLIRYQQTSKPSGYEDSFTFFLSDGLHNSSLAVFSIKLNDYEKSDLTVLALECVVEHGGEAVLNSNILFASDNSSRVEDILFVVLRPPIYGSLVLSKKTSFQNFTLLDIINNQLSYKHNETFTVSSDSFDLMITNGMVVKNATINVSISSMNNVPILERISPLYVNKHDSKSFVLTSEHLMVYNSSSRNRIKYIVTAQPKFGYLMYSNNVSHMSHPDSFSQGDIDNGRISYFPYENSSTDNFFFKLTHHLEDGYLYNEELFWKPTVFQIFIKSLLDPVVFISSPTNLEAVWHNQMGFGINSYNLKATYPEASADTIIFTVTKYFENAHLFHLKQEKIIRTFSQEDINEQFVVIFLKTSLQTSDFFTFHVAINGTRFEHNYRMDIQWSVVYLPYAEYYVCENEGALNINIQRSGNLNVSSYVTISGIEQTAKEGLDYVSRWVSKLQFDPGEKETTWKIVIVIDDLKEAPIEQMLVSLSDPENAVIINYNRTIVSIFDFNTGFCANVLKWGPQGPRFDANTFTTFLGRNVSEEVVDSKREISNNLSIPMECNKHIYGLLHFEKFFQTLFQCNGVEWIQWSPKDSSSPINVESSHPLHDYENPDQENIEITTLETFQETTQSLPLSEAEGCMKGWQEFSGKCYKLHKPPATWSAAQGTCKSYSSGNLVVIESLLHNNWLLQLARNKPFWIGLHISKETNDWSPPNVPFVNWKRGFPRFSGEIKHGCVLVRGSGFWINKNCESYEHSYICTMPM